MLYICDLVHIFSTRHTCYRFFTSLTTSNIKSNTAVKYSFKRLSPSSTKRSATASNLDYHVFLELVGKHSITIPSQRQPSTLMMPLVYVFEYIHNCLNLELSLRVQHRRILFSKKKFLRLNIDISNENV